MSTYNFEQLLLANELGEVIRLHNQAIERLVAFRQAHPNLIAPNLARMAEENLKENVTVLYRELNNIHKPKAEQRRHVCRECHNVFVVPLPGGICDECRSKLASPPSRPFEPRPLLPEAETETASDVTPVPQEKALVRAGAEEDATEEAGAEAEAETDLSGLGTSDGLVTEQEPADIDPVTAESETHPDREG